MGPRGALWGPWGALGGALGMPRGAVGDPRGSLGEPFLQTGAFAKSVVLSYDWVHFGCHRDLGGITREEVVDQSWPPN